MKHCSLAGISLWFSLLVMSSAAGAQSSQQPYSNSEDAILRSELLSSSPTLLPYSTSPLLNAVSLGFQDVVIQQLKGAKVREEGPDALMLSIQQQQEAMTRLILAIGVSPNQYAEGHWYPLAEAAKQGDIRAMCLLLDYGANPNLRNERVGNISMALAGQHIDAAILLMSAGYVPDDTEVSAVTKIGAKRGLSAVYEELLRVKHDDARMQSQCEASWRTWKLRPAM